MAFRINKYVNYFRTIDCVEIFMLYRLFVTLTLLYILITSNHLRTHRLNFQIYYFTMFTDGARIAVLWIFVCFGAEGKQESIKSIYLARLCSKCVYMFKCNDTIKTP